IRVFDPVHHERLASDEAPDSLEHNCTDERWVPCRRPLVAAGGELTMSALELQTQGQGVYRAPLQMLANGGVLGIGDFGRQKLSAQDLLNRWIGPLESRIDFLRLPSGQSCQVPFDAMVVFATNLRPADLADEAHLRRIHYKVLIPSPTLDEFVRIFENYCR